MRLRPAAPDDARAIADIHIRGWQTTYRGVVPDEVLDGLTAKRDERAARFRERAGMTVAERDGHVIGFSAIGPSGEEGTGTVQLLYVAAEAQGAGAGSALLERAVADLGGAGYRFALLLVFEGNAGAQRFYERHGWAHDGTVREDVRAWGVLRELPYRRPLPQPSSM